MTQSDRIESKLDRLLELLEVEVKKPKRDYKAEAAKDLAKYLNRKPKTK